jgi:hypothetical protein
MEILDVPEVRQLPELSGNAEDPIAFADMVLTNVLGYDNALLYAEHSAPESSISWRIEPRSEAAVRTHEIEIAISPSPCSFRAVLARFGHHYMSDQLCNGYALRFLRQYGRIHRCHIYMSNTGQSGFWIRVYAGMV